MIRRHSVWVAAFVLLAVVGHAVAQVRAVVRAGPGSVPLPYSVNDNTGTTWMLQRFGWIQQQGNQPIYSQAAVLQVNNNQLNIPGNIAQQDEKTGEIIFTGASANQVIITRRVQFKLDEGYVRIVDIFRNPQGQDATVSLQWMTNLNYGVQNAQMVDDPKRKNQIAWVAQTPANRTAVEIFGGKGAKSVPTLNWQNGNNVLQAQMSLTIPAGKEVGIMHLHLLTATQESGMQFVQSMKEAKLMADLPPAVRRVIVNFDGGANWIGDREILRGDTLDIIELRGGDQLRGTLKEDHWKLETFYGAIDLPTDRVRALINVGQFRPRQLVVTADGEIFGGKLSKDAIGMEMSSGQVTQVPLSQIMRIGYRKQPGESDEAPPKFPMVALRSGDRVTVAMPAGTIDVATCYGLLKLKPETISSIAFQSSEHDVPQVQLTDGSRFSALLVASQFEMKLLSNAAGSSVVFPVSSISGLHLTKGGDIDSDDGSVLKLTNDDVLFGTISGELKLDTAFDTISIKGAEVRSVARAPDAGLDVQVMLWDQTTLSGQLQSSQLTCALGSGVEVQVPVALIDRYTNSSPAPSSAVLEKIKAIVKELSADDWKQRDRAEQQLITMGPVVLGVLKQLSPTQAPEAQQRIDAIIKQMEKSRTAKPAQPTPINQE